MVKQFWFQGKSKDEKKDYLEYLKVSPELALLRTKLVERISEIQAQRLSMREYDKASWPYLQAELNGEEKSVTTLLSYLDFS